MYEISEFLKKYNIVPKSYQKNGKATIVNTKNGKYVIKNKNRDNNDILKYLLSRNFDYFPKLLSNSVDDYELIEYVEDIDMPEEQKMMDMIDLIALLHSKTTYYKEVDIDDFDKIYDDINNNIAYLYNYYNDIMTIIFMNFSLFKSKFIKFYTAYMLKIMINLHNCVFYIFIYVFAF